VGFGEVRLEGDSLPVDGDGFVPLPVAVQCITEVVVGLREGRSERDGPPIGGDGWLEFEGYGRVPVRIDVFEPVTRLSWRWGDAGKTVDEGSTLVEFRLEPLAGGGTRLHLRESASSARTALEQHRGLGD
jgi:uncharacterized protein YndB with AHSA1/START domain